MESLSNSVEIKQLAAQQQLFQNLIRIQNICFDKCMSDGVDSYLSSRQESCLGYCADRYIDSVLLTTNRFNQRLGGGQH